jgi:AraC-like DNA-binding protein
MFRNRFGCSPREMRKRDVVEAGVTPDTQVDAALLAA